MSNNLSERLAENLKVWVTQASRELDALERLDLPEEARPHYARLRSLHKILAAEVAVWGRYPGTLRNDTFRSGENLVRKSGFGEPGSCVFFTGVLSSKEKTCCGGRRSTVPAYTCSAFGSVTLQDCRICRNYVKVAAKDPDILCDYLVLSKRCAECEGVRMRLGTVEGAGRRLVVRVFQDEDKLRGQLDRLGLREAYAPCLIERYSGGTASGLKWTDDPADIVGRLEALGYSKGAPGYPVDSCVFALNKLSEVEWACPRREGGKTDRESCKACSYRIPQFDLSAQELVDLFVCDKKDVEALELLKRIDGTVGISRELRVLNVADGSRLEALLRDRIRYQGAAGPLLFSAYVCGVSAWDRVVVGFPAIGDYLRQEAYIHG